MTTMGDFDFGPTIAERKAAQSQCRHSWVAGMMHVHDEDVESVAAVRHVECEKCEVTFSPDLLAD